MARRAGSEVRQGCGASALSTREGVAAVIALLARHGLDCAVAGGWAEELLGLRDPSPHSDIDLVYLSEDFRAVDAAIGSLDGMVSEVLQKRFKHKRAFLFEGTLCELVLIRSAPTAPVTFFWGDVPFRWELPLLHGTKLEVRETQIAILSEPNLRKYRNERASTEPYRWRDPASLDI
jgi:hypothetical protein